MARKLHVSNEEDIAPLFSVQTGDEQKLWESSDTSVSPLHEHLQGLSRSVAAESPGSDVHGVLWREVPASSLLDEASTHSVHAGQIGLQLFIFQALRVSLGDAISVFHL